MAQGKVIGALRPDRARRRQRLRRHAHDGPPRGRARRRHVGHRRRQAVHHERRPGRHVHRHRPDRHARRRRAPRSARSSSRPTRPGFSVGRLEEKLGLHASATGELHLRRRAASRRRTCSASRATASGRSSRSSTAAGSASARWRSASPRRRSTPSIPYAQTREQFGRPIGTFQGVAFMIADMATEIEAARAARLARGLAQGPGPRLRARGGPGEAVRVRGQLAGHQRRDPGPRRLRLRRGVQGRALLARRQADRDRRGDEPDPAARHRPAGSWGCASSEAARRWPLGARRPAAVSGPGGAGP